jgi:divalent metal cation (Fe/Co/Zn/Cd) transporter
MRFLAGSSVPTPGFDHFSKKKKKKKKSLIVEASALTWSSVLSNLSVLGGLLGACW